MPANEFIDLLNQAKQDIASDKNLTYWQMTLSNYPPTFFGICENAIKASNRMINTWLQRGMLKNKTEKEIEDTVNYLSDYHSHLLHNDRLSIDELKKNTILNIKELETDQDLQEYVYLCITVIKSLLDQQTVQK